MRAIVTSIYLEESLMRFKDRMDAGKQLAETLTTLDTSNTVVIGLPRGGVPLALELAAKLNVPYDVILAKKIGHPESSEYEIGAIAEGGEPIFNQEEIVTIQSEWLKNELNDIQKEMVRRRTLYNKVLETQELSAKDVIIVDDGIATGFTMFAAIKAVKKLQAKSISVAVPIIPKQTYQKLTVEVDHLYCIEIANPFLGAVGAYYQSYPQLDDIAVQKMLAGKNDV